MNTIKYLAINLLSLVLALAPAWADPAALLPQPYQQFLDNNGNPLSGGKVYNYVPGTTTPKTTWSNPTATTPNANPITLDAGGRAQINGTGSYRQRVTTATGSGVIDGVTSPIGTSNTIYTDALPVGAIVASSALTAPTNWLFAYGQEVSRATYSQLVTAITDTQAATVGSGSPTVSGLTTTTQMKVGLQLEGTCFAPGTVVSALLGPTSFTASNNAVSSGTCTLTFWPFGNGNGSTTFNVPDMRGAVPAGRDSLGDVSAANRITSAMCSPGTTGPYGLGGYCGIGSTTIAQTNLPNVAFTVSGITLNDPGHETTGLQTVNVQSGTGTNALQAGGGGHLGPDFTGITVATQGTAASGGSGTALTNVQSTIMLNYIIKVATGAGDTSGVISLGGMFGDITCGTGVTCANNEISFNAASAGVTSLTGDVTGTGPGATATTLATVNSNVGTFGSSTLVPIITVNGKGLITGVTTSSFSAAAGALSGATLASNVLASSLTSVGTLTGGATGAGFTIALGTSTVTGTLGAARMPALTGDVTTTVGTVATTIANGAVTGTKTATNTIANSNLVQSAAVTLKGNPTNALANAQDFTIGGLTALASPDPTNDYLLIWDHTAGVFKKINSGTIASAATSGVSSLGGATGALTLSSGLSMVSTTLTSPWDKSGSAINYAGGNVGVAITTPAAKLTVSGTSTWNETFASTGTFLVLDAASSTRGIDIGYDPALPAGFIQAGESGVGYKPLLLNPNGGNVGIGSTAANGFGGSTLQINTTGSGSTIRLTDAGIVNADWAILGSTSGVTPLFRIYNAAQGLDRFVITSGGNVGIGVLTPTAKLEVAGAILIPNNTGFQAKLTGGVAANILYVDTADVTQLGGGADVQITAVDTLAALSVTGGVTAGGGFFKNGSPWADVKAYGACGCSSGNDAAAINAAITAVQATHTSGGVVYLPPGNYLIGSTITVPNHVTLVGAGLGATSITIQVDTSAVIVTGRYSGFRHLSVQGYNNSAATANAVVYDSSGGDGRIEDCYIFGGFFALQMDGVDGTVMNCHIGGAGTLGGGVISRGANWYIRAKIDSFGGATPHTQFGFYQGTSITANVQENHFTQSDFSGDYDFSIFVDDGGGNTFIGVFDGSVMSAPIFINKSRWVAFNNAEIGSTITQNGSFGNITIGNSYAFSSISLLGGGSNHACSNNINITC